LTDTLKMDSKNMIHVKAKLDTDFRRFQCVGDYATVLSTLRNLFHITEQETFLIKFLDDEGDLCTISSQHEFEFAVAHSQLLKITLFKQEAPKPAEAAPCLMAMMNPKMDCLKERLAAINAKLALPNLPPHKVENLNRRKKFLEAKLSQTAENPAATDAQVPAWKLGCGLENRLAGIDAKLEQNDLPATKKEALLKRKQMLEAKLEQQKNGETPTCKGRGAHLENRLAWINAKLSQPDLPKDKVEKLTKRKEFLEAQINKPQATDATTPHDGPHFQRGRCGGPGNHNLEQRLAWITAKLEKPDLPAHKVEKLTRRKEMLEAKMEARKNGTETEQQQQCPWTGRLEARIAMFDAKLQQPNLPEHKKEKFLAKKAWLEAKLKAKQAAGTDVMTPGAVQPTMTPGATMPLHHFYGAHPPMYAHGVHPHHGHFGHPHHAYGFGHPHHAYGPPAHHGPHAYGFGHPHPGHAHGHAHGHPHHAQGHRGGF